MSNRIDQAFERLAREGRRGLLPYITAGYPDMVATAGLLRAFDRQGVTAVELGIPYSDSIADGPVIQTSFTRVLDKGFRLDDVFAMMGSVRGDISIPVLAMVSFSIVYRVGVDRFIERAKQAGFDGLIIPDLSLEEAPDVSKAAMDAALRLVMLVAPTSSTDRRERIAALSSGFVYYISVAGITGERSSLPADLVDNVNRLRSASGKPVAVGFGISKPEHVRQVCAAADGAIVGSAIVRRINQAVDQGQTSEQIVRDVSRFISELMSGLD